MSSSIICNQYKRKLTEHPLYIFVPKRKIIPELHLFASFLSICLQCTFTNMNKYSSCVLLVSLAY